VILNGKLQNSCQCIIIRAPLIWPIVNSHKCPFTEFLDENRQTLASIAHHYAEFITSDKSLLLPPERVRTNKRLLNFKVQTNQLFGSNSNVILTRQTCGHRSSRVAGSKRRALAFLFSVRIWYVFWISKCRGELDLGLCMTSVLLCCIDPRVSMIRNEASSCPGIFSKTLRLYYVGSSPGSPLPCLLDGHRKLIECSAIAARSCPRPVRYPWGTIAEMEVPRDETPGLMTLHPHNANVLQSITYAKSSYPPDRSNPGQKNQCFRHEYG